MSRDRIVEMIIKKILGFIKINAYMFYREKHTIFTNWYINKKQKYCDEEW